MAGTVNGATKDVVVARLNSAQVAAALREAQQLQQDGQLGDAIQICEELLEGGVDRADVHYFLGWLYQEADRWEEAAGQFEQLLNDPDYSLSCYYALGQCARAQGNIEDAARYFDEAVDRVNLDALERDETDQLLQLCQEAAEAHREMGDLEGAETVYTALLGYLRSQGWQDRGCRGRAADARDAGYWAESATSPQGQCVAPGRG